MWIDRKDIDETKLLFNGDMWIWIENTKADGTITNEYVGSMFPFAWITHEENGVTIQKYQHRYAPYPPVVEQYERVMLELTNTHG